MDHQRDRGLLNKFYNLSGCGCGSLYWNSVGLQHSVSEDWSPTSEENTPSQTYKVKTF